MLAPEHRLRRTTDFTEVVRGGRRASRRLLTVHLLPGPAGAPADPTRAGLVVGKSVGASVVRHRTARQLRHLLRDRLTALPGGSRLVVRAHAQAAGVDSATLGRDLDAALAGALPARPVAASPGNRRSAGARS